jgi:dTDP-4-amino-4,6-dideoxygalactose transaminase
VHPALERFDVPILYDNAHGLGTISNGGKVRLEPGLQAFSLHATKMLPAVEGGLLYSADAEVRNAARQLRGHGLGTDPLASKPGYNLRMDEIRAQIGLANLAHLDGDLARRRDYAERLRHCAVELGHTVQKIGDGQVANFQSFGVRCRDLPRMMAAFDADRVGARRYFHPPLHHMKAFAGAALPVTDAVWADSLSLPIYSEMTEVELQRVEAALRRGS